MTPSTCQPDTISNLESESESEIKIEKQPSVALQFSKNLDQEFEGKLEGNFSTDSELTGNFSSNLLNAMGVALSNSVDEAMMKTHEIAAECKKYLTLEQVLHNLGGSRTPAKLFQLWVDLNSVFKTGTFCGPASPKVAGQFSHLSRKFAKEYGVDVVPAMVRVVRDWVRFGKFLKGQGVVQDFPDKPHPGFFLKHAPMALQFEITEASVKPKIAVKLYLPEGN